jgi:predicted heme/steroid binding protein
MYPVAVGLQGLSFMRVFTLEELSTFNGKDGRPVYVAYAGNVYDVSESKLWKAGIHMRGHHAGRDLTEIIVAAPHGPEVLRKFPHVGVLKRKKEPLD